MLNYNPIVSNGVFFVSDGVNSFKFKAVDKAEAIWKFCKKFGYGKYNPIGITVHTMVSPVRKFDK